MTRRRQHAETMAQVPSARGATITSVPGAVATEAGVPTERPVTVNV
ncbi:hypothetical protein [Pseudonocardia alni]